jgi:hypothetical protein
LGGTVVLREKWPVIGRHEQAATWLQIWTDLGRAPRTIDPYARGLAEYLLLCEREGVDPVTANRAHVAVFMRDWPVPGVLAIFRFMSETEISFDVDLRELQGQEGIDTLCAFLRAIGSRLGKPVLMTPEGGSQEHPVLGYDPALNKVTLRTASIAD